MVALITTLLMASGPVPWSPSLIPTPPRSTVVEGIVRTPPAQWPVDARSGVLFSEDVTVESGGIRRSKRWSRGRALRLGLARLGEPEWQCDGLRCWWTHENEPLVLTQFRRVGRDQVVLVGVLEIDPPGPDVDPVRLHRAEREWVDATRQRWARRATRHLRTGLRKQRARDLVGAVRAYDRALQVDPAAVWPRYHRALVYAQSGRSRAALQDLALFRHDPSPEALEALEKARSESAFDSLRREGALSDILMEVNASLPIEPLNLLPYLARFRHLPERATALISPQGLVALSGRQRCRERTVSDQRAQRAIAAFGDWVGSRIPYEVIASSAGAVRVVFGDPERPTGTLWWSARGRSSWVVSGWTTECAPDAGVVRTDGGLTCAE